MIMKRKNAVTAMIVLFICVAVYLNWSYTQNITADTETGKTLGEVTFANGEKQEGEGDEGEKMDVDENQEEESEETVADDYFTNARLEKQKARDSALTILKENSEKENISQQERDKAASNMESLATGAVTEARVESLIKAKGFKDCVALINDEAVNVIVKAPDGGLTASDTTKIKDIVISETKVKPSQIKIVEIK